MSVRRYKILVCRGPECGAKRDSSALYEALKRALRARDVGDSVTLGWQSCFGRCSQGVNCLVREIPRPGPGEPAEPRFLFATLPARRKTRSALYNRLTSANAEEIVDEHVVGGRILRRLIERPPR